MCSAGSLDSPEAGRGAVVSRRLTFKFASEIVVLLRCTNRQIVFVSYPIRSFRKYIGFNETV